MYVTYIVLDPRKPGRFTSPLCSFLFQPVYVGKGNLKRADGINRVIQSPKDSRPHSGALLHCWCIGMHSKGIKEVPVVKISADDENHSFDMEGVLTHYFGIKSEGGILFNGRHGGQGGYSMQESTKKLLSELNSGEKHPQWGTTWSDSKRAKWEATWEQKRIDGSSKRSPESMMKTWAPTRRTYQITDLAGNNFLTSNLTDWCKEQNLPLSAFRKALKEEGIVTSGAKQKSRVDGWSIKYMS